MVMSEMDDKGEIVEKHKIPPPPEEEDSEFSNAGFEVDTWFTVAFGILAVVGICLLLAWALHVL